MKSRYENGRKGFTPLHTAQRRRLRAKWLKLKRIQMIALTSSALESGKQETLSSLAQAPRTTDEDQAHLPEAETELSSSQTILIPDDTENLESLKTPKEESKTSIQYSPAKM